MVFVVFILICIEIDLFGSMEIFVDVYWGIYIVCVDVNFLIMKWFILVYFDFVVGFVMVKQVSVRVNCEIGVLDLEWVDLIDCVV